MKPQQGDEADYPERADAYSRPPPGDDLWPRRIAAIVAVGLMLAPFCMTGNLESMILICWLGGTVAAVVLGVLASRHASKHFRPGDIFYIVLAALLSLYGGGFLFMMWMFRDGWHS